ncbi:hypothetical protein A2870_00825 [Candidatus Curtissbacteria bacterium RIFCSPHIGHO2_01_FULL_41_11]|uniref:Adenylate kinase n=1 Tax=Candidatus Curtissbacteria bacterium RIFCSPHIGHO2_01_FULL_41_11 TaxID=1797711 RepID=A0A1F5G3F7_9BACT|nr:MAG: hypothetical protein A2870_00825 [Candidatus Curtissbacteria bacterium RIFCSPHIGHO2_01_FULL_41_11]
MKIIFLGAQGSGKSTQAKMLSEKLGLPYIEMGQLLRDKSKDNDEEGGEIRQALEVGNLVPDTITIGLMKKRVSENDCKNGYVLDGYPRNYAQIEGLPTDIDKVFYIKVSDNEGIKRLIARGRHDDSLDVITRRLELYHKETEPLLTYFRQQGNLEEINGVRTQGEVQQDILSKLGNVTGKD